MAAKYHIYARGRWCEVDIRNGRVEGFKERARFLFFSGGKLELARTANVLHGLRALAGGKSGPLRDGPRLPQQKRRHRRRSRRERNSHACAHHGCCLHSRCDFNANDLRDKLVPPPPLAPPTPSPSKRRIIYSDESPQTRPDKSPVKRYLQTLQQNHIKPVEESVETSVEEIKVTTRSTASKVEKDNKSKDSSKEQARPLKKLNNKEVSVKDDRDKTKKTNKNVSVESAEQLLLRLSDSEDTDKRSYCSELAKELVIDEDDVIVLRRYLAKRGIGDLNKFDNDEEYKKRVFYKLNPLVALERCQPLENLLRQKMTLKEFARNLGLRSVAEVTPEKRYRMRPSTKLARAVDSETDKENIVKPKRRKLWNNDKEHFTSVASRSSEIKPRQIPKTVHNEDSSKDTTDSDTEFKRKVREQLARKSKQRARAVEREIETTSSIMTEKEQRKTRSSMRGPPLKEHNKTNGDKEKGGRVTASVSEDFTRRTRSSDRGLRIPPRALKEQNRVTDSSDSVFETSKLSPKKAAEKEVQKAGDTGLKKNKKGRVVKEAEKIDESAEKTKPAIPRNVKVQLAKIKASSVPPGREYTNIEDHAIVAWVSVGGRERRVNGNALWRELQAEYRGITGQDRSWHSLRNRYLRYVLPGLGRLALPPHQVSRLRAAASAGVLKAGSGPKRRNSIYSAPVVRSASARAARPPADEPPPRPTSEEPPKRPPQEKTPPKPTVRSPRRALPSPSYSTITRRFAARTRASASLASSPARLNTTKRRTNK